VSSKTIGFSHLLFLTFFFLPGSWRGSIELPASDARTRERESDVSFRTSLELDGYPELSTPFFAVSLTSELIKMHGGTLSIESTTSEDSPTGSHGSTFIARIPLGTSHLPKDRIEETADPSASQVRPYSQGIIAEAENWFSSEGTLTQSDSSSQSDSGGSTENSSRIDPATLFWSKADTILIVDDNVVSKAHES